MKVFFILTLFPIISLGQIPDHLDFYSLPICPTNFEGWCKVHVDDVRPTQANVGYYHLQSRVDEINKMVRKKDKKEIEKLQRKKTTEFILGPDDGTYINDRHHYSSALHRSNLKDKQKYVAGKIVADYSEKKPSEFWKTMEAKNWAFLKDKEFKPIDYTQIPKYLDDLNDNPLRSLVSQIFKQHEKDGIIKVGIPFEEFFYAEFLQAKGIRIPQNHMKSMKKARKDAVKILKSKEGRAFMAALKVPKCNPAKLLQRFISK